MQASLERPKLRPLENQWTEQDGKPMLILRDRLGLTDRVAILPPALALLLSLCDGTRDLAALRTAFMLRTGLTLTPTQMSEIIAQFDSALLLDSPRLARAQAEALAAYRAAPMRAPALADRTYPAEPEACHRALRDYASAASPGPWPTSGEIRGLVSPHIDYQRGGPVYSQVWSLAAEAVARAEVVVVFGTDHAGGPGQLTLTRQSYATPFGVLPTALDVVDAVADALGEEAAYAEELHHRNEHSIELAAVWLHHLLDGNGGSCQMVPILCGSFQAYVEGTADPADDPRLEAALAALRRSLSGRRTLVVAAADLAHVGPAFGDSHPFGAPQREQLAQVDDRLLETICAGDAAALLACVREERDRWRVCGLPPIYMALRLLDGARGDVVSYAQCPADHTDGSWVSVAGVVFR